jgi:hypothetical protein
MLADISECSSVAKKTIAETKRELDKSLDGFYGVGRILSLAVKEKEFEAGRLGVQCLNFKFDKEAPQ